MRRFSVMTMALVTVALGAAACGHETRTIVRRETVQTQVAQPPTVIEKRTVVEPGVTVIHPEPVQPQKRVYEERRTTIEE